MWILKNIKTSAYVAKEGHLTAYTSMVEYARLFRSEMEAENNSFGENEIPVPLNESL